MTANQMSKNNDGFHDISLFFSIIFQSKPNLLSSSKEQKHIKLLEFELKIKSYLGNMISNLLKKNRAPSLMATHDQCCGTQVHVMFRCRQVFNGAPIK